MKKIIICLMMALLFVGGMDAKVPKRQTKKKRHTTTATTKSRSQRPVTPISSPTKTIDWEVLKKADVYDNTGYHVKMYKKALQGDPEAQYNVALWFSTGKPVEEDEAEALRWYYLAAQQGHADSQWNVGMAYEDPEHYAGNSVQQNYLEAAKWYAKAAAQGYEHAADYLGMLIEYNNITQGELQIANEQAGLSSHDAEAYANRSRLVGKWRRISDGQVLEITFYPSIKTKGVEFEGSWTSDGGVYVDFRPWDNYSIKLFYKNGQVFDDEGRKYVKVN